MSNACYVYAIVRRDTPLAALGHTGADLMLVPWHGLAAVVGRAPEESPAPTLDAVLHHEAIVEAVRGLGPALPVRFGTVFRNATSVAAAIAERYESLASDLDRLGDRVEVSLTALWVVPPAPDASTNDGSNGHGAGARYLLARAAELRRDEVLKERAAGVAAALDQAVGARALERRVSLLPTPRVAARIAYLLDAAAMDEIRRNVERFRAASTDVRVLLTGPWPPYSFVSRVAADGRTELEERLAALAQPITDTTWGRHG